MKKLILATVLSVAASAAFAGSYNPPIVDEVIIVEDVASSTGVSWVAPVMAVLIFLAILS